MRPKVLVVGAGAVGQVFGWHLASAGAELVFLVKPSHALGDELPLLLQGRRRAKLKGFRHLTSVAEVAQERWDQVWLAVPSDALRQPWLPELLSATGSATVVALAPESEQVVHSDRLVLGAIPFLAWQHPLPGAQGEPAMAYWMPPLGVVPLSGPRARVAQVLELLRAGGLRCREVSAVAQLSAPVTSLLIPVVVALELGAWSIQAFRGRLARLAAGAAREAFAVSGARGPVKLAARGWILALVVRAAAYLLPLDLSAYLKAHFTKVGEQTEVLLEDWLRRAEGQRLAAPRLRELTDGLRAARR